MNYRLSRLLSAGTAAYGGYALAQPRHLGEALSNKPDVQASYDVVAQTYGVRDLAISALGIFGRSDKTVRAAMVLRIAMDVADCAVLVNRAEDDETRQKVMGVTLGWAALNTVALVVDGRRARSRAAR